MLSPKHSLKDAIRATLLEHGVNNARVIIELLPKRDVNNNNGSDDNNSGHDSNGEHCLRSGHVSIQINVAEGTSSFDYETAGPFLTSPRPLLPRGGSLNSACLQPSSLRRESRDSLTRTPQLSVHTSKSSVGFSEERRLAELPVKKKLTSTTPVFKAPNNTSFERVERPSGVNNSARSSSVQIVESPQEGETQRHTPRIGETGGDISGHITTSISNTLHPKRQSDTNLQGTALVSASTLPPVEEKKNSTVSAGCTVSTNSGRQLTRPVPPPTEPPGPNSKQRLQHLLQEQQSMEQQSRVSRAKHEKVVKEAEEYLRELQRTKGTTGGEDGLTLPQISFRSGPASHRPPEALCTSAPQPGGNGIKVVKFTMPAGGKAKEEVMMQLSSSPGGAQHVSNKDKFSMLLQEQENLIKQQQAGEEEYQKLLKEAIAFHERQNELRQKLQEERLRREQEDDDEEDKEEL